MTDEYRRIIQQAAPIGSGATYLERLVHAQGVQITAVPPDLEAVARRPERRGGDAVTIPMIVVSTPSHTMIAVGNVRSPQPRVPVTMAGHKSGVTTKPTMFAHWPYRGQSVLQTAHASGGNGYGLVWYKCSCLVDHPRLERWDAQRLVPLRLFNGGIHLSLIHI